MFSYFDVFCITKGRVFNIQVGDPDTERQSDHSLHFGRAGFPQIKN